jgi:hypothetical protein
VVPAFRRRFFNKRGLAVNRCKSFDANKRERRGPTIHPRRNWILNPDLARLLSKGNRLALPSLFFSEAQLGIAV